MIDALLEKLGIRPKRQMLYKCIPFSKAYWHYIMKEKVVRFATIPELIGGNDQEEFEHRWDTRSQFFLEYGNDMRPYYDDLFDKTVILSLGKSPNRRSWQEYCSQGGVRYEFRYDPSHLNSSGVNSGDVAYDDDKTFSLSRYLTENVVDEDIRRLLQVEAGLTRDDKIALLQWLKSGEPNKLGVKHINDEIAFKKKTAFRYEDEYRFVHLTSKIGPNPLKVVLTEQKLSYHQIGLTLVSVSTTDVKRVRAEFLGANMSVREVSFCD
jgi:hypothetical protein